MNQSNRRQNAAARRKAASKNRKPPVPGYPPPEAAPDPRPEMAGGSPEEIARQLEDDLNEILGGFGFATVTASVTPISPEDARRLLADLPEAEPEDARLLFRPDDKVKSLTQLAVVPPGAIGTVQSIENPDSFEATKGRHFVVTFDMTPYDVTYPPAVLKEMDWLRSQHPDIPPLPEKLETVTINVRVSQIETLVRGVNWQDGYTFPYAYDAIGWRIKDMSPREQIHYMSQHDIVIYNDIIKAGLISPPDEGTTRKSDDDGLIYVCLGGLWEIKNPPPPEDEDDLPDEYRDGRYTGRRY